MAGTAKATRSALAEAQELIYDAWEIEAPDTQIALARLALAKSPLCADAYLLLAEHSEWGSDEELDLLRSGVEAGKAALGDTFFETERGAFWGILETRPYMRLRLALANALLARGAHSEAIEHLQGLMALDTSDRQGARYLLAACLANDNHDRELARLLEAFPDDSGAAFTWTAVLLAFRQDGASAANAAANREGSSALNPHVPDFLLSEMPFPRPLPALISVGKRSEAIHYAADFRLAWLKTPGAFDWLRSRLDASGHTHH